MAKRELKADLLRQFDIKLPKPNYGLGPEGGQLSVVVCGKTCRGLGRGVGPDEALARLARLPPALIAHGQEVQVEGSVLAAPLHVWLKAPNRLVVPAETVQRHPQCVLVDEVRVQLDGPARQEQGGLGYAALCWRFDHGRPGEVVARLGTVTNDFKAARVAAWDQRQKQLVIGHGPPPVS